MEVPRVDSGRLEDAAIVQFRDHCSRCWAGSGERDRSGWIVNIG